jgi:Domain of unknown function (DUF4386)
MNAHRTTARVVGLCFLAAMAGSLIGGGLLETILSAPDYLLAAAEHQTQLIVGVLLELVNATAVLAIGFLMFPVLKKHNEQLAVGYLAIWSVEAVVCSIIVIGPLALLTLSREYGQAGAAEAAYLQAAGALGIAERARVVGLLIPLFFSLGAILFYTLLYRSRLLPRFISVWGFIGAALILIINIANLGAELGLGVTLVFVLPIILNEIFLGIWLIVRGFNPSAAADDAARQLMPNVAAR